MVSISGRMVLISGRMVLISGRMLLISGRMVSISHKIVSISGRAVSISSRSENSIFGAKREAKADRARGGQRPYKNCLWRKKNEGALGGEGRRGLRREGGAEKPEV